MRIGADSFVGGAMSFREFGSRKGGMVSAWGELL